MWNFITENAQTIVGVSALIICIGVSDWGCRNKDVDFENPKISDLKLFLNILQALGANKVWIHCAKNYRVSAFMYVYHKYILHTPFEEIDLSIFDKWQPSLVWQELMKVQLEDLYKA